MKKLAPATILFLTITVALFAVFGDKGLVELLSVKKERHQLELANQKLETDIVTQARQIEDLKHNGFALEQKAREELGFTQEGEIIYIFPDEVPVNEDR